MALGPLPARGRTMGSDCAAVAEVVRLWPISHEVGYLPPDSNLTRPGEDAEENLERPPRAALTSFPYDLKVLLPHHPGPWPFI